MPYIVLIVEDNEDVMSYMVFLLRSCGYQVCEAINGSEAVKCVNEHRPDLILMDIAMPVMDGLEATRMIRALETTISQTPIVAVTAFDYSYSEKAINVGCNDVLPKPVDFDMLESVIQKYLPCV